jgi:hypothetical protein
LSLPDPALVVLVEPFADNAALPREKILQRILSFAARGCVLCMTAAPRDALELGGSAYVPRAGQLEPLTARVMEPLAGLFGYIVVSCEKPRALIQALAAEPAAAGLEWRDHAGDRVLVWGSNDEELALAVVKRARAVDCGLKSIVPARASIELVHAAQAGWARAVHERAWWRAEAPAAPATPSRSRGETSA